MIWHNFNEERPPVSDKKYLVAWEGTHNKFDIDVYLYYNAGDRVFADKIIYDLGTEVDVKLISNKASREEILLSYICNPLRITQTGFYRYDDISPDSVLLKMDDAGVEYWAEMEDINFPDDF